MFPEKTKAQFSRSGLYWGAYTFPVGLAIQDLARLRPALAAVIPAIWFAAVPPPVWGNRLRPRGRAHGRGTGRMPAAVPWTRKATM